MENQGKNFHAHVKEAVDAGNAKYKAEQTAQKEARMSAERARKQEIMDQRNAERQALAAKREERRQVKIKFILSIGPRLKWGASPRWSSSLYRSYAEFETDGHRDDAPHGIFREFSKLSFSNLNLSFLRENYQNGK